MIPLGGTARPGKPKLLVILGWSRHADAAIGALNAKLCSSIYRRSSGSVTWRRPCYATMHRMITNSS